MNYYFLIIQRNNVQNFSQVNHIIKLETVILSRPTALFD